MPDTASSLVKHVKATALLDQVIILLLVQVDMIVKDVLAVDIAPKVHLILTARTVILIIQKVGIIAKNNN